ncbi:MAG: AMP-binding protein [Formosimonas sp.]
MPNANPTISDIIVQRAQHNPHEVALRNASTVISNQQLLTLVSQNAQLLKAQQISCLGIYMDNSIDWAVVDLAAMHAGITVIPIPLFFSAEQIGHLINDAGIQAIALNASHQALFGESNLLQLDGLAACLAKLKHVNQTNLDQLHAQFDSSIAKVTYTSGSTGQPKGVCLSQANMLAAVHGLAQALDGLTLERHLCVLPLATLLENIAGLYLPLYMNSSVVIEPLSAVGFTNSSSFEPSVFLNTLSLHQPSSMIVLPELLKLIVENFPEQADGLDKLRLVAVGGGKTPISVLKDAKRLGLPVYEGYGLSECASVVSLNTPDAACVGSVGKPLPHVRIVLDKNGEVVVKGQAMLGYLHAPADAQHSLNEIRTGDLATLDAQGFLHIHGRSKNLIISSYGRNISPEWVEAHALQEPAIQQIAVFGDGQPSLCAVIVSDAGAKSLEDALDKINASLPDYARIQQYCLAQPFSKHNGLLTANGRLKRDLIYAFYQQQIESLYATVV